MGSKRKILSVLWCGFLLASCKWGQSEEENQAKYIGCYGGQGVFLKLDSGVVESKSGSYIYKIYKKKIGLVLAANFSLRRNGDGSLEIIPSNYERYYQIQDESLELVDSSHVAIMLQKKAREAACKIDDQQL